MQNSETPKLQLSVLQVVAGALAAVTAAAVASTLGVAGTLLGAAVMSTVATVGSALYNHSFEQARTRIRMRRNPRTGEREHTVLLPAPRRRMAWGWIAGTTLLVFALALGGITAVEVLTQQPLATTIRGAPAGGSPPPPPASETTLELVFQPRTDDAPLASPTPDGPDHGSARTAGTTPPEEEAPADGAPTSDAPAPMVTPTASSAEGQPMLPPASPEPPPLPNPTDTPAPPTEQP